VCTFDAIALAAVIRDVGKSTATGPNATQHEKVVTIIMKKLELARPVVLVGMLQ
tara:strand:+ start:168 stop:329 length:162 start_codon:yes stop_codon:yes gene_type:complete